MATPFTSPDAAKKFMLGGKSYTTLVSLASGARFTYRIELADKKQPTDADCFFVSVLNGPDNWVNYKYIGIIKNNEYRWTAKSKIAEEAPSVKAFKFCFAHLSKNSIVGFEVWHEGKCGRCGRRWGERVRLPREPPDPPSDCGYPQYGRDGHDHDCAVFHVDAPTLSRCNFHAAHPSTNVSMASDPATALRITCARSPAMRRPAPTSAARTTVWATAMGSALMSPLKRAAALEPEGRAAGHEVGGGSPRAKPGTRRLPKEIDSIRPSPAVAVVRVA